MVNGHLDLLQKIKKLDLDELPPISTAVKRFF